MAALGGLAKAARVAPAEQVVQAAALLLTVPTSLVTAATEAAALVRPAEAAPDRQEAEALDRPAAEAPGLQAAVAEQDARGAVLLADRDGVAPMAAIARVTAVVADPTSPPGWPDTTSDTSCKSLR